MRLFQALSYRNKLLILMLSMVIFMGATMGLLIRFIIFPCLTREMEERGLRVAHRLAESTRISILTRDRVSLTASIFDEKRLDPNIAYILVSDESGDVLAHTFITRGSRQPPDVPQEAVAPRTTDDLPSPPASRASRISSHTVPVYEELTRIGTVQVGLDTTFIHTLIRQLSFTHLGFTAFIILIGVAFALTLSRVMTGPITSLTVLAGEISQGNLNARICLDRRKRRWVILPDGSAGEARCIPSPSDAHHPPPASATSSASRTQAAEAGRSTPDAAFHAQTEDEIVRLAQAFNHMTYRLKASEMELRQSEERYRQLFNRDPNPVFVIDSQSHAILDANERAAEKYGYSGEELLRLKFTDLGFPENALEVITSLQGIDKVERPCHLLSRIRHRTRDGRPFWVNLNFCCYDHMGKSGYIITTTDVTTIIEAETQLVQAGKMATLGEMSTGVAHELNQPLNTIRLGCDYLQMASDGTAPLSAEQLRDVAQEINEQVERASAIINHLRQFGRRSPAVGHLMQINAPIQGAFTLLGQQLKLHTIDVVTDLGKELPPILADENRIEQVLINLITNARDAMDTQVPPPTGIHRLTIRSFLEDDRVVVTVSDTGTGIPRSVQDRIFEPFYTTKEVGKGTGLGLSISYGIVHDYNGTIGFETEEGEGTTFRISFPAGRDEKNHV